MADIRSFIQAHLLQPLKQYPTIIQDTMIEVITQKLQDVYNYTKKFPEILSPDQTRLDILQAIANQFLFTVRDDADIQEQIDILDNILYVYRKRGSVDTIENMWKYYGGSLPRDVKVIIPSYNLFRYSVSTFSGTDRFLNGSYTSVILEEAIEEDIASGEVIYTKTGIRKVVPMTSKGAQSILMTNTSGLSVGDSLYVGDRVIGVIREIPEFKVEERNSPGMYEIRLTNNTYPIPDLKEFLVKELVAAGNFIYFTNSLHMDILDDETMSANPYKYDIVNKDTLLNLQLSVLDAQQGLSLSGYNPVSPNPYRSIFDPDIFSSESIEYMTKDRNPMESLWSGRGSIFLELSNILEISNDDDIVKNTYKTYEGLGFWVSTVPRINDVIYYIRTEESTDILVNQYLYCTPEDLSLSINRYLYDKKTGILLESSYPGYFVLGETLLDTTIANFSN